jgi:hypothetical protein
MRKRIFILESEGGPKAIEETLMHFSGEKLEFKTSNSKIDYKRNLPRDYDLYLIHLSHTDIGAVNHLKELQPWSKIFARPQGGDTPLPYEIQKDVEGKYLTQTFFQDAQKILKSINVRIKSWEERHKS